MGSQEVRGQQEPKQKTAQVLGEEGVGEQQRIREHADAELRGQARRKQWEGGHPLASDSVGRRPDLPEDLWRHVLGKLSATADIQACALVCSNWRTIVRARVTGIEASARDFFEGNCFGFQALSRFHALTSLKILPAGVISQPKGVEGLLRGLEKVSKLPSLKSLLLSGGKRWDIGKMGMEQPVYPLPASFGQFGGLENLVLEDLPFLGSLESVAKLPRLGTLMVLRCPNAVLPQDLSPMTNLETLTLKGCSHVPEAICSLTSLKILTVCGSDSVATLPCVSSLVNLQRLNLSHCSALAKLPEGLEKLPRLECLNIFGCRKLAGSDVDSLRGACPRLQVMRAWPVTYQIVAVVQRVR